MVFVAFYTGSSNAQTILKEAQTKASDTDPQTVKKAEILLESLSFLPKRGRMDLDKNSTLEDSAETREIYTDY